MAGPQHAYPPAELWQLSFSRRRGLAGPPPAAGVGRGSSLRAVGVPQPGPPPRPAPAVQFPLLLCARQSGLIPRCPTSRPSSRPGAWFLQQESPQALWELTGDRSDRAQTPVRLPLKLTEKRRKNARLPRAEPLGPRGGGEARPRRRRRREARPRSRRVVHRAQMPEASCPLRNAQTGPLTSSSTIVSPEIPPAAWASGSLMLVCDAVSA